MAQNTSQAKAIPDDKRAKLEECGLRINRLLGTGAVANVYEGEFMEGSTRIIDNKEEEQKNGIEISTPPGKIKEFEHESIEGKRVAIKWMEYEQNTAQRIIKEVETMDEIHHDNVTNILAVIWFKPDYEVKHFVTDDDGTYNQYFDAKESQDEPEPVQLNQVYQVAIVMELAEHGTGKDWLDKVNKRECRMLRPDELFDFCKGMRDGLEVLHKTGVAHNDLHFGNVLVFDDGKGGFRPKLSDFGMVADSVGKTKEEVEEKQKMEVKAMLNICSSVAWQATDFRPPDGDDQRDEIMRKVRKLFS